MNTPVMFASGEHLAPALITLYFAGASFLVALCLAVALYFTDKTKKRRLYVVGVVWAISVLLTGSITSGILG